LIQLDNILELLNMSSVPCLVLYNTPY
jgi:hypothetical protein